MDKSRGQLRPKNSENSDSLVVVDEAEFSANTGYSANTDPNYAYDRNSFLTEKALSGSDSSSIAEDAKTTSLPTYDRLSFGLLIATLFVVPFLFGGRSDISASVLRAIFFTYFSGRFLIRLIAGRNLWRSKGDGPSITLATCFFPSKNSYACFALFIPFLCYLSFQIIPLPYSVLSFLSPDAAEAYLLSGAFSPDLRGFAPLSLEPSASLDGLMWVLLVSLLTAEFVGLRYSLREVSYRRAVSSSSSSKSRSRSRRNSPKSVDFGALYRLFDSFSETLHRALIYLGVLLSLVSVGHLAVGAEILFGYFSPDVRFQGHSRAHWPLVSPNHLATILAVSLVLVFVSILRERQLRALRVEARREGDSPIKAAIKIVSEWEQQGMQLFMFFVILLALLLTGSRAAIFLSMCSISVIWVAYRLDRVTLISQRRGLRSQRLSSGHGRRKSDSADSRSQIFSIAKTLLFPIALVLLGLFFLGDSARNQLASRVEDGIHHGLDDGRSELNGISVQVIKSNPLWGVGLNAWRRAATEYASPSLSQFDLDYAHNEFLQLASEIGIFGMLMLTLPIILMLVRRVKRVADNEEQGLARFLINLSSLQRFYLFGTIVAAILPFLHALVDFPFHMPAVAFAVFACVIISTRNILSLIQRKTEADERSLLH